MVELTVHPHLHLLFRRQHHSVFLHYAIILFSSIKLRECWAEERTGRGGSSSSRTYGGGGGGGGGGGDVLASTARSARQQLFSPASLKGRLRVEMGMGRGGIGWDGGRGGGIRGDGGEMIPKREKGQCCSCL